jgi:hypothetical protein
MASLTVHHCVSAACNGATHVVDTTRATVATAVARGRAVRHVRRFKAESLLVVSRCPRVYLNGQDDFPGDVPLPGNSTFGDPRAASRARSSAT